MKGDHRPGRSAWETAAGSRDSVFRRSALGCGPAPRTSGSALAWSSGTSRHARYVTGLPELCTDRCAADHVVLREKGDAALLVLFKRTGAERADVRFDATVVDLEVDHAIQIRNHGAHRSSEF